VSASGCTSVLVQRYCYPRQSTDAAALRRKRPQPRSQAQCNRRRLRLRRWHLRPRRPTLAQCGACWPQAPRALQRGVLLSSTQLTRRAALRCTTRSACRYPPNVSAAAANLEDASPPSSSAAPSYAHCWLPAQTGAQLTRRAAHRSCLRRGAAAALLAAAAAGRDHSYVDAVAAGADTSALAEATAAGEESVVALLLAAGADPGVVLPSGETPLHRALGRTDVAARLLDALAARRRKPAAAGCVTGTGSGFAHAALDRPRGADGATAAHVAAAAGDGCMLRLLARSGADLHARAQAGATPLLVAAASGQHNALHALLECLHARAGPARGGAGCRCSGACSRPPATQGGGGGEDGRGAGRERMAGSELARALAARDETTSWSALGWALARADAGALAALLRACKAAGLAPLRLLQDDQPVLTGAVRSGHAPNGNGMAALCSYERDTQPWCTAIAVTAFKPVVACCEAGGITWQAAEADSCPSSEDSARAATAAAPAPAEKGLWGPGAASASAAGAAPWAALAATPAAAAVLAGGWRALGALAMAGVRLGALCTPAGPGAPALLELAAGLGRTRCLKLLLDAGALLLGSRSTWSHRHGLILGRQANPL